MHYLCRIVDNYYYCFCKRNHQYNSYAGIYDRPIDGIRIKSSQGWVKYRVHIKGGDWLPWAEGFGDSGNLFAGIYGKEIDGIQMY